MHKDTAFVRMNSPMKFLGVWIALEDVSAGSGELIYFPGSHRWEDYLFSGRFKHYDRERDGEQVLDDNYRWIYRQADQAGIEEARFLPKKGDALIWHADLAHGGANVVRESATRRSLVGHFCARNVKPLYAYYKPARRKVYADGDRRYMSSYYSG
jgi:ectoine hydroxylase-related dioxygenase (phytanoyl-CoA dioxygenase family)